jgi:2-amino-4-hydroxy-6-hydroxymethyldihydropteridine diphosphokinase
MPQAYVSLGSNICAEANICSCTRHLRDRFKNVVSSAVYRTPAEGFDGAPFLNSVVGFETAMSISELRTYLRNLEDIHGRVRSEDKFSSRTLDIDLLLYDNVVMQPEENLPHHDILRYAFVLLPLAEIAPEQTHPVLNKNFRQLAQHAEFSDSNMVPVTINCHP